MRVRQTIIAILLALGLGGLAWSLLDLYSIDGRDADFLPPVREYLRAALALDSIRLVGTGAAQPAVRTALDAARAKPVMLRALLSDLRLRQASHNGTQTALFFNAPALARCAEWPLTVFVEGTPGAARIREIRLPCAQP